MAPKRVANRLKALDVVRLRAGLHRDGAGLLLQVVPRKDGEGLSRSWLFRYTSPTSGKRRDMGLGSVLSLSLAEARTLAKDARASVASGIDPIDVRSAEKSQARLKSARAVTFRKAAASYIVAHRNAWGNDRSEAQWTASLEAYAYPVIGNLPVADIDLAHIRKVLDPIWHDKAETARRVRARIEAILDRETGIGSRTGDNPARQKLILATLGKQRQDRGHHAALPYGEIGEFMNALRAEDGLGALALELTILCATRTGETIGAKWSEIDLTTKTWAIPGERMKNRKPHTVPLSDAAIAAINKLAELRTSNAPGAFVFPGMRKGKSLSNMAMLATLKRMKRSDLTVHGFRSCFTDWARETTNFAREIREASLAHTLESATEAAYARGDLLEKRRNLMNAWAKACATIPAKNEGGKVVPINRRRAKS